MFWILKLFTKIGVMKFCTKRFYQKFITKNGRGQGPKMKRASNWKWKGQWSKLEKVSDWKFKGLMIALTWHLSNGDWKVTTIVWWWLKHTLVTKLIYSSLVIMEAFFYLMFLLSFWGGKGGDCFSKFGKWLKYVKSPTIMFRGLRNLRKQNHG
jgi:hypothetical protein